MAFVWSEFSTLAEQFQWRRHIKLLLAVPFLVVLAVGSYKIGHQRGRTVTMNDYHPSDSRVRRDVGQTPTSCNESSVIRAGGAVYTRWGRTVCPSGSDAVYSGIVGGSHYAHAGGGSNYLCLPSDPIWGRYNEGVEKLSKLYGAEYELSTVFDLTNMGGRPTQDNNVPCVVCRSQTKTSVVMIPARNLCYHDWTLEYAGYLMAASSSGGGRTKFVCVDGSPEADPAGFRDENGALFYNVEGVCGSLPCPPYVPSREFICAVCTK